MYRARDVAVGDEVAIKVLDKEVARTPQALEWFRREVRLARRISHPNVARTHDMGEHGGFHYLIMELIEGRTLEELLYARGPDGVVCGTPLPPVRAAQIAVAVCDGLAAAHAAGVVHRDLKPANVLIEASGRVVITDFGIARGLADELGRTQGIVGTPLYMAPEQVSGKPIDARTDLYSLGLGLFEMLTGALPFTGQTPLLAAMARLDRPPPDPRELRAEVPEALAQIVTQCMAQEPEGRPSGAAEVGDRLRAWLAAVGAPAAAPITVPLSAPVSAPPSPSPVATTGPDETRRRSAELHLLPAEERALAVLPLRYQGPPDQSYLGDAVTEELIDVLSRTRGLRVLGSGATARFRDNRDPKVVGAELGAFAVVDATLQCSRTTLRVLARLVEVSTGVQLWSERFERPLSDLLELQDHVSKRIAEALRVELTTAAHRGDASLEATSLYLRARRKVHAMHLVGPDSAVELLEACLAQAPGFRPAIACQAVACVRAWFVGRALSGEVTNRDLEADARRAVAQALAQAPDLAETQLACGMLAVQTGEWKTAVQALVKALEIAPTYAHAHQYLAQLQCECGNTREGVTRALLAVELEPGLSLGLLEAARVHALHGELDEYERLMARVEVQPTYRFPVLQLRMRVATWYGDLERPRRIYAEVRGEPMAGYNRLLIGYARTVLGEVSKEEIDAEIRELLAAKISPRMYTVICQLAVEVLCARGYPQDALEYLRRAIDAVLTDLEWLDHCPLLAPMRALPEFRQVRKRLRVRVDSMWIL